MPGNKIGGTFYVPFRSFFRSVKGTKRMEAVGSESMLNFVPRLSILQLARVMYPRSYVNAKITTSFSILYFLFVRDMVGVNDEVQGETAYNGSHNRKKDGS